MKKSLLILSLALFGAGTASAEPFRNVGFAEIRAAAVESDVAQAKRLMILLSLYFGPEEQAGYPFKDENVRILFVWDETTRELARRLPFLKGLAGGEVTIPAEDVAKRFEETRAEFVRLLLAISRQAPGHKALRTMGLWGYDTWVMTDPAIPQHSERILSYAQYQALKLK